MVYFFSGWSLRPIQDLRLTISAITEDDLQKRIPDENRNDEVGVLGQSFNIMLDRLEKSVLRHKRFSASVVRELKMPLVLINAGIQALQLKENPSISDYEEMLAITLNNVKRLMTVVDDLLTLYDEQLRFYTTTINLQEIFELIRYELLPFLAEKHIKIELSCRLRNVRGNPALLYRTFFNLLENAVKYNRDGGKIVIETKEENNVGKIIISDTGNGIAADELQRIFEPFYRVNKSRSRNTGGVGLGLSIV
jgi:signal transduction histidine kinase